MFTFPAISTGVYGYPKDAAAKIAVDSAGATLPACPGVREVIFCCHTGEDLARDQTLLDEA